MDRCGLLWTGCVHLRIRRLGIRVPPGVPARPSLLELHVGLDSAATLLVTAGDNPDRLQSEGSWAHLCGVAPLPAGSGKTSGRNRLNRGGDRQANAALYRIVLTRMSNHPETRRYVTRRRTEGLNTPEIMRSLKRYVSRQVFKHLQPA